MRMREQEFRFTPSPAIQEALRKIALSNVKIQDIETNRNKPDYHFPEFTRLLKEAGTGRTMLTYHPGKSLTHLERLADAGQNAAQKTEGFPPDVSARFAKAYLEHVHKTANMKNPEEREEYIRSMEERRNVFQAIGYEGTGVNHFWTFAPYLFHELTENLRHKEADAIKILVKWAEGSLQEEGLDHNLSHPLDGLDFLKPGENRLFRLEPDNIEEIRKSIMGGLLYRSRTGRPFETHEAAAALARELAPALSEFYGKKTGTGSKKPKQR